MDVQHNLRFKRKFEYKKFSVGIAVGRKNKTSDFAPVISSTVLDKWVERSFLAARDTKYSIRFHRPYPNGVVKANILKLQR